MPHCDGRPQGTENTYPLFIECFSAVMDVIILRHVLYPVTTLLLLDDFFGQREKSDTLFRKQ